MAASSARILTRPSSVVPSTTAGFVSSVPKTAARTITTAAFSRPSLTTTSQQQPASSSALPSPAFTAVARFHSSPVHSLPQIPKPGAWAKKGDINYEELKPITDSPTGEITIIDVREPNETAQGMIPSAVNVPLSEFTPAFKQEGGGDGDFLRKYSFHRPGYDDQVVFYCRSGKRSAQALEEVKKFGWHNARNYRGSWLDWTAQEQARGKNDD